MQTYREHSNNTNRNASASLLLLSLYAPKFLACVSYTFKCRLDSNLLFPMIGIALLSITKGPHGERVDALVSLCVRNIYLRPGDKNRQYITSRPEAFSQERTPAPSQSWSYRPPLPATTGSARFHRVNTYFIIVFQMMFQHTPYKQPWLYRNEGTSHMHAVATFRSTCMRRREAGSRQTDLEKNAKTAENRVEIATARCQ